MFCAVQKNFPVGGASFFGDLPFGLLITIVLKVVTKLVLGQCDAGKVSVTILGVAIAVGCVLNRLVAFYIPLVILKFVTPSVAELNGGTSLVLKITIILTCNSSINTTLFSATSNFLVVPRLSVRSCTTKLGQLPRIVFRLRVPRVVSIVDTLIFTVVLKLTTA